MSMITAGAGSSPSGRARKAGIGPSGEGIERLSFMVVRHTAFGVLRVGRPDPRDNVRRTEPDSGAGCLPCPHEEDNGLHGEFALGWRSGPRSMSGGR